MSRNVLFPLLVFPFLTFAGLYFILHQSLIQTGLQFKMDAICDPDLAPHPYRLAYTNTPNADKVLCGMVVFFHTLIDTACNPLLAVLFPAVGVVGLIPFLEAARDRCPFTLRMPTAIGVFFQLASMGVVMPLYALFLVITGTASILPSTTQTASPPSKINQGNAEALLFGFLLGYVLPTTLMVLFVRPSVTAIWQGFPILFALAIFAHKVIRPPSRYVQSGHPTIVATLAFTFLLSALLHVVYVWPVLTDIAALRAMFVPVVDVFDPEAMSLADGVLEFIKWDLILGVGSVILATFWMADSAFCLVGIFVWHGIVNIAFGPPAAIAGVFLWRERRLNGQMQADKIPQKTE
ncbi:hypothetical protein HD554DRAFT_221826 [Boletus coccyginus]|nr:hypothetical protein HD554DRAFT_221826 [Boletus coccyginus]